MGESKLTKNTRTESHGSEAFNRIIALVEHPDEPYELSVESELAVREYLEGRADVITGDELRSRRQ